MMYVLVLLDGVLFVTGREQPACMAVAFILIPVCMLLYRLQKRLWLRANQRLPQVCVQATLVNHRQVYEGARLQNYKRSYLTFETENGALLEFEVPREEFDRIQLGAKGPLEYRSGMYVSFRKEPN